MAEFKDKLIGLYLGIAGIIAAAVIAMTALFGVFASSLMKTVMLPLGLGIAAMGAGIAFLAGQHFLELDKREREDKKAG